MLDLITKKISNKIILVLFILKSISSISVIILTTSNDCLMCHVNQKEGDVIGVMNLTFSLDEADSQIAVLVLYISIISTLSGK